jgi:hypothetical protein
MRVESTGVDFRPGGIRYYRIVEVKRTFIGRLVDWLSNRPDYAAMITRHVDGVRDGIAWEICCCTRGFITESRVSIWTI